MKSPHPRRHAVAVAAVLVILTSACATGPRAKLGAVYDPAKPMTRQATGNEAIDKVLNPLEQLDSATFTATYTVTTKEGGAKPLDVVVAQQQPLARSITIGDTRYIQGVEEKLTCSVSKKTCEAVLNNSRVPKPLGSAFFDTDVKNLMREQARTLKHAAVNRNENIIDQDALCVALSHAQGDSDYCILPNGTLAKVEASDVTVVLTALTDTVDPASFARTDG